ncbi:peptide/nickel transport system ATP-binding protein [Pseudonocardia hierapolitana]|uniref:Peptide/nickel transport system ATP-binding protein n=1 Tax=Pseudonocardia hierapolitana TaxID=1128676 RepID=A0A561SXC2_9PSEU|nr:ABC transporter ATP-binding protein [Pseudonocardia hierapolitana]TWF79497.1 peptide/nickel transport system ATP-binding protein [Pseudonocardia hierapolitana]
MTALEISGLTLGIGDAEILRGVDLDLEKGRIQGLAGESGSGKTMTGLAVMGLLPARARVGGTIAFGGRDLLALTPRAHNDLRGTEIAMVFQDPSTSLHPMLAVGAQLTDHLRHHLRLDKAAARARAVELLERVRIPDPASALRRFPHQFSGGQRQRIAIAIALACSPSVLIADEPTTALDVTVQAGVLHLLRDLAREMGLAVLLVTHDLGVMSAVADRVAVMRDGEVVENGECHQVFTAPAHPYTASLLASLPGAAGGVRSLDDVRALEEL